MRKRDSLVLSILLILMLALPVVAADVPKAGGPGDLLIVSGVISDAQKKPLKDVEIGVWVNDKKIEMEEVVTGKNGAYEAEFRIPAGSIPGAVVEIEAGKASFRHSGRLGLGSIVKEKDDGQGSAVWLAHLNIQMARAITPGFWVAAVVLLAVYGLIAFELMHRTLAAFLGASVVLTVTYLAGTFFPEYRIIASRTPCTPST
jgi:hypothetical protein